MNNVRISLPSSANRTTSGQHRGNIGARGIEAPPSSPAIGACYHRQPRHSRGEGVTLHCHASPCSASYYIAMRCHASQCTPSQSDTMHHTAVLYAAMRCHTLHCIALGGGLFHGKVPSLLYPTPLHTHKQTSNPAPQQHLISATS